MASLSIGRITDTTVLDNIKHVAITADQFQVSGRITVDGDRINKAKAARDQVVGLLNGDEPFVPFRIDDDPTLDGMVKIRTATCDLENGSLERGRFPWSITCDRVPGGALPNMESPLLGGFRNNAVGIVYTGVVPWHAVPAAALDYYDGLSVFSGGGYTLPTQTGDLVYYQFAAGVGRRTARYALPTANIYDGAALIEQAYPDGNYYKIIGRAMYSGLSATGWRIGNGIIRLRPGTAPGTLDLQMWNGTAWGTVHNFTLDAYDGVVSYTANRINTVTVLRNSPEECRIRLTVGLNSTGVNYAHRTVLDIRIRRGARVAELRWSTFGTALLGSVRPTVNEAGTPTAAGGGVTTTPDADANIAILLSPANASFSNATSQLDATGVRALSWSFGLGMVKNNFFAVTPWTEGNLQNEYFAPYSERATVVGW